MSERKLRDYQIVAREFIRGRKRAALWLDMGLGKTAVCLSALRPDNLPVLVVAPKRVAENVWDEETADWRPDLTCVVAAGEPHQRRAALQDREADIVALGQDNIKDLIDLERDEPFRTLIIDESSGYKDWTTARFKAMQIIASRSEIKYVWELTGTPSPNGLTQVWSQIFLLDFGQRLGRKITGYLNRYFFVTQRLPNGVPQTYELKEHAEERIHEALEDIVLAMDNDGRVELPELTHNPVPVVLPPRVMKEYRKMARDLVIDLREIFGGEIHTAKQAAALSTKLSQIAAGFIFEDPLYALDDEGEPYQVNEGAYTWLHDESIKAVKEVVELVDSPIMVLYRYVPEKEHIAKLLGKDCHTIDEPGVVKAWNRGEVPVLLCHPKSVGHGLNLQHGGHHALWASPTWDLELWDQANKRLHRPGQEHPVVIHSLIRKDTIDPKIHQRLIEKGVTQDALMAYLESPI